MKLSVRNTDNYCLPRQLFIVDVESNGANNTTMGHYRRETPDIVVTTEEEMFYYATSLWYI